MIVNFNELEGKTLTKVENVDNQCIIFTTDTGEEYYQQHKQDCCESVSVEDIVGELKDLIETPILMAEEIRSQENPKSEDWESFTWTFYKLATIKGYVTIRWYGTSNGHYSESVTTYKK